MNEWSRAALRRRPLLVPGLLAFAFLVSGCGGAHVSTTEFASGPRHVSAFAFDDNGRLWMTASGLAGHNGDGVYLVARQGARARKIVGGLVSPLGLVWLGDRLLVSSLGKVTAYSGFDGHRFHGRRVIVRGPVAGGENNNLVLAPNGRVAMGVSASCDHCTPATRWSGSVVSFEPDGSDLRIVADGIRAPFGLAYARGRLYVTMNQRDDLGENTPGDWLAVVRDGQHWGFPRCYGQGGAACRGVPEPLAVLDKHAAAGGVALLGSTAVVAEWQSGKVLRVTANGNVTTLVESIRNPLPVIAAGDGTVLVGDWSSGTLYRVGGVS